MIWGKSPPKADPPLAENRDEKLKRLLKTSGSDFQFDPNAVKYRLLTSMNQADQSPRPPFHITRVTKYSIGFAGTVILLSATFALASNSKPGDKLFALNKLGEQIVLNLPLSVEQKAKVEAYIVTNRLKALDQVQAKISQATTAVEAKNLETVKETDESFTSAIDEISQNKQALEARGNNAAADRLEIVLDQLQTQAQQREATITALEDATASVEVKVKIQAHLFQLKSSGQKARLQIKRFINTPDQGTIDNTPPDNSGN
jgi:hypothetical protein